MATFKPPTDDLVVWADRGERGIMARLAPGPRGRNIFRMIDGSYREDTPGDWWNIEKTYHGGHIHELTETERLQLIAAGYGDYIYWRITQIYGISPTDSDYGSLAGTIRVATSTDYGVMSVGEQIEIYDCAIPGVNGIYTVTAFIGSPNKNSFRASGYTGATFPTVDGSLANPVAKYRYPV